MTTHPPSGPVTPPPPTRLVDFLLDLFVVVFKAIPRGARR